MRVEDLEPYDVILDGTLVVHCIKYKRDNTITIIGKSAEKD